MSPEVVSFHTDESAYAIFLLAIISEIGPVSLTVSEIGLRRLISYPKFERVSLAQNRRSFAC